MHSARVTIAFLFCGMALFAFPVQAQDDKMTQSPIPAMHANIALGAIWGTWGISVGAEKIMEAVTFEDFMIDGTWGVGADIGYARDKETYSYIWSSYSYTYTYIPIFLYASYHHTISSEKLDPFVKLGLGYVYVKFTQEGNWSGVNFSEANSHLNLVSQIGARYKLNEKISVVGTLGHPWLASAGIDISL